MAISFSLILLLLALTTAAAAAAAAPSPHHPPISAPSQPPASPPADIRETHLDNIIDALIGAGDFAGWANLLSTVDPSSLPLTATFFIPAIDDAALPTTFDGFLIAYHIVPQRLTFSDLQRLSTRTRLPTLLPAKYIVVTDNSPANFTVDGSRIAHPDVFVNAAFTVHGLEKPLDYSVYGDGRVPLSDSKKSPRIRRRPPPPPKRHQPDSPCPGEANTNRASGRSSFPTCVLMVFPITFTVLRLLEMFS